MTDTDFETRVALLFVEGVDARAGHRTNRPAFEVPRARVGHGRWLAVAAAVAVVVALAVTLSVALHRSRTAAVHDSGIDDHYTETVRYLDRLLAATPTLPGATAHPSSPDPALSALGTGDPIGHAVYRRHWYTAKGTVTDAVRFYSSHRTPGLRADGCARQPTIAFVNSSGRSTTTYLSPVVQVAIVAHGGGVAIGVAAKATWLTPRPAGSIIRHPTSVVVTVRSLSRLHPRTVSRTLGDDAARHLAQLLNRLPSAAGLRLVYDCPVIVSPYKDVEDELVFRTAQGSVHVGIHLGCPPGIEVAGTVPTPLLDSGTVLRAVLSTLDLPADFGSR